jgi:hypothetical protein
VVVLTNWRACRDRSFRDWVDEQTTFAGEIAEAASAHLVGSNFERAYRRNDALRSAGG